MIQKVGQLSQSPTAKVRVTPAVREALYGYVFAMPGILGLVVFVVGPLLASIYFSLTEYSIGGTPTFVGLQNYRYALTQDELFWPSLGRTFYFVLLTVPGGIIASLILASLLNQGLRGTVVFRSLFFLPSLTPAVAMTFLWAWIFHPSMGPINYFLWRIFGIEGPKWLGSREWVIPSLSIMAHWATIGGSRLMILLAGLQGIPEELYDAAKIDGASRWRQFWYVTLPMLSPTIFFVLVLTIVGAFKVFASAYVATRGGPARASWFFALHIYTYAFQYFDTGYASALAWILVFVLLVFTAAQFRIQHRWVYYAGEVR